MIEMLDSETSSFTPIDSLPPTALLIHMIIHYSGSESPDDYDTTLNISEEEDQSYHKKVPWPEPSHTWLDFISLNMDRASTITDADLQQMREIFTVPKDIKLKVSKN